MVHFVVNPTMLSGCHAQLVVYNRPGPFPFAVLGELNPTSLKKMSKLIAITHEGYFSSRERASCVAIS